MLLYLFTLTTALFLYFVGARRRRLQLEGSAGRVSLAYTVLGPPGGEPWLR
jgi:hypothetical protein